MKTVNKRNIKNMKGGDGYAVNVYQAIAGRPSYIRYTDNCRPVFNGPLLQGGGSGNDIQYSDPTTPLPGGNAPPYMGKIENSTGEVVGFNLKNYENFMVIDSTPKMNKLGLGLGLNLGNEQMKGGKRHDKHDENCECNKKDDSVFSLLKQQGGFVGEISQFAPIQTVAKELAPLGVPALTAMILLIFLHHYMKKRGKGKKGKMMGGFSSSLESVLAPLGKSNLLVLASILLLHHYAMMKYDKKKAMKFMKMKGGKKKNSQRGGSIMSVLENLLAPLGVNALGASLVLVGIRQSFMKKKKGLKGGKRENDKNDFGDVLRNSVKELNPKQLIAGGIFRVMEKMFMKKMKMESGENRKMKNMKGGVYKYFNELFEMVAPVAYSTFATQETQKKANKITKFIVDKNKNRI